MSTQRMDALATANAIRLERSRMRRDIGAGRVTVAVGLAAPCCATAMVMDVLSWQHRWTLGRAERFLNETAVCTPWQTAGRLTDRQRVLIARSLRTTQRIAA